MSDDLIGRLRNYAAAEDIWPQERRDLLDAADQIKRLLTAA